MALSDTSVLARFEAIEERLNLLIRALSNQITRRALTQTRVILEDEITRLEGEIAALQSRVNTLETRLGIS